MPGVRQWYYLCSSVTDCTNRRRETLAAIPRVTLEVAREVERVGARRAGADRNDDRLETLDLGETRAHLGDQLVLRHQQKIPADVLRQAVGQFPLVLGKTALQLPFDRIEGVRAHVVDQRSERLAIVGKQCQPRMLRECGTDDGAEFAPAAQPAERVVFGRQLDADSGERIAAGEQDS